MKKPNPLKRVKSAFNRAGVNHPDKIAKSVINTGQFAFWSVILIPLDMGLTTLAVAGTATVFSHFMGVVDIKQAKGSLDRVTLTHQEESYYVTRAQKRAYDEAGRSLDKLKQDFQFATRDSQRRKLQRRADKLLDFQDDIMASKNVIRVKDAQNAPKLDLSRKKHRGYGN